MARDLGIDLARIRGTERGGRIVLADIRQYVQRLQQVAVQQKAVSDEPAKSAMGSIDFSKWGRVRRKKMSTLRTTISSRMVESWTTIPHITQFDEVDVSNLLLLRKKYASTYEKKGGHLTLTPFVMKVLVQVLQKHPMFNASVDGLAGEIVYKEYYHFGIAVDTERGLIVPVIRDVDKKNLLELAVELHRLAERTRERKVSLEEMQGGSFTISNQGGIGGAHFTPIINKPEVAILGMGRGSEKAVVRRGKIAKRVMLPVALSYDHRIIDGADAARFMVDFAQALQDFKEADVKI
jgi:pyruvate dehydrogenase E2 component (dihydrolipoamide acetyltransferase)